MRDRDDERESIIDILTRVRAAEDVARGVPEERARETAERFVKRVLELAGGRAWYMPLASTQRGYALAFRDDAIRAAASKGASFAVIRRSFKVSRGHYYRILNGGRTGNRKRNPPTAA